MTWDLIIVGAGAAGLMAAARAAELGCRTLLLEKNTKVGVKILMSGGTRCNITHATNQQGIADAFAAFDKKQAGFLRSALAALPPEKVIELIEAEGVATKVEDTGKIFPVSNRAIDVRDALVRRAKHSGAMLAIGAAVAQIEKRETGFIVKTADQQFTAPNLLITSGGQSLSRMWHNRRWLCMGSAIRARSRPPRARAHADHNGRKMGARPAGNYSA